MNKNMTFENFKFRNRNINNSYKYLYKYNNVQHAIDSQMPKLFARCVNSKSIKTTLSFDANSFYRRASTRSFLIKSFGN